MCECLVAFCVLPVFFDGILKFRGCNLSFENHWWQGPCHRLHTLHDWSKARFTTMSSTNSALVYICMVYSGKPRPGSPSPFPQLFPPRLNPTKSQEITNFLGEPGRTWADPSNRDRFDVQWDAQVFKGGLGHQLHVESTIVESGFSTFSILLRILTRINMTFSHFFSFPRLSGMAEVVFAAKVSSGKNRRVARYFDSQFFNICRRRCRSLWPAGLPCFRV